MKASEFILCLQAAIAQYGDLELVVGYDCAHAKIVDKLEDDWDGGSYGFGPRNLVRDNAKEHSGLPTEAKCFRI